MPDKDGAKGSGEDNDNGDECMAFNTDNITDQYKRDVDRDFGCCGHSGVNDDESDSRIRTTIGVIAVRTQTLLM